MTLNALRYIVAVANERSFGCAAQRCFVRQQVLSVAIQKLEDGGALPRCPAVAPPRRCRAVAATELTAARPPCITVALPRRSSPCAGSSRQF